MMALLGCGAAMYAMLSRRRWSVGEIIGMRTGASLRTLEKRLAYKSGRKTRSASRRIRAAEAFEKFIRTLGSRARWWRRSNETPSLCLEPLPGLRTSSCWRWKEGREPDRFPLAEEIDRERWQKMTIVPWMRLLFGLAPARPELAVFRPKTLPFYAGVST